MKIYMTVCVDNTVMLMTSVGQVIGMFSCYDEAVTECAQWIEDNSYYNDENEIYLLQ
jgi:hypothetical protein